MGNSHLYSHPWRRATVVRLDQGDMRHYRGGLMAHGIELSFTGMPARASAGVVDREGECET
jgi:hypothetical protein